MRLRVDFMSCLLMGALIAFSPRAWAGPTVRIVIGADAPRLERFAAGELAEQFTKLFAAEVTVSDQMPTTPDESIVLVGSPATNPAVKRVAAAEWPELSDQGHLIKSTNHRGQTVLIAGGGSPVATLWAVYELGHHYGIRYLLSGDVFPNTPLELKLDGFDIVLEPALKLRAWRTVNDFAIGPESWGIDEHRRVLRQLAKQKYNRVVLSFYPWQPFVDYEFRGVKKQTAKLWFGYRYRVDGDTAGRVAFGAAKEFYNPDLAGKTGYDDLTAGGIELARGILDAASELGMSTAILISPLEFPREFAAVLPGAKVLHGLESLTIGPGPKQTPDDSLLKELVRTKLRAYLTTYPDIDAIYLTLPEFPDWVEHYESSWQRLDERHQLGSKTNLKALMAEARQRGLTAGGERGVTALKGNITALDFFDSLLADEDLWQRANPKRLERVLVAVDPALYAVVGAVLPRDTSLLNFIDYTARRVAAHKEILARVSARTVDCSLIFTLADDNVGVLPQSAIGSLHQLSTHLQENGWQGFLTRYWMIGDLEPSVYYLSRAGFAKGLTPRATTDDLITATCGPGVADRINRGLSRIEEATELIDEKDMGFTFPVPGMVMKQYRAEKPPAWWAAARDLYSEAMTEMFRGHDRAEPRGRPLLRYYAKRCEFAVEYFNSIEALRYSALADRRGDQEEALSQMEVAVESMYNGVHALSEVVRGNSDRGLIAVLNAYGYHPLLEEFEKQVAAAEK